MCFGWIVFPKDKKIIRVAVVGEPERRETCTVPPHHIDEELNKLDQVIKECTVQVRLFGLDSFSLVKL